MNIYNLIIIEYWENVSKMRKPLIAAVNGYALGKNIFFYPSRDMESSVAYNTILISHQVNLIVQLLYN